MTVAAKTEKAIVAKGRSVHVTARKTVGEGEEVELPVAEVAYLRRIGFLVDPKVKETARGFGPNYDASRGAKVRKA